MSIANYKGEVSEGGTRKGYGKKRTPTQEDKREAKSVGYGHYERTKGSVVLDWNVSPVAFMVP